jgi:hypothetical protein
MPRRERSQSEMYLREVEEHRRREQEMAAMRVRAAQELGEVVIGAGGLALSRDQLRMLVGRIVELGPEPALKMLGAMPVAGDRKGRRTAAASVDTGGADVA